MKWIGGACLAALILLSGCQGTESRDQVEDTVETLSGKQQVERMQDLKEELKVIQQKQTERYDQLQEDQ
jgi:hypothetical protein